MVAARPKLYTLMSCPAVGDLGEGTGQLESSFCRVCHRRSPPELTIVELRIDRWAGEDLLIARGIYAISERLCAQLDAAGVTGATYEDMIVSTAPDFEIAAPAYQQDLPVFRHWSLKERVEGPEVWWRASRTCDACGETVWQSTEAGRAAMQLERWAEVAPRAVYEDCWPGVDVFLMKDPGPPIVTDKVVGVFERLGVTGLELAPVEWAPQGAAPAAG